MNKLILILVIFCIFLAYNIFMIIRNKYVFRMCTQANDFCYKKTIYCIEYISSYDTQFIINEEKILALYSKVQDIRKIYDRYAPSYANLMYKHISFNYKKLHREYIKMVNQHVAELVAEVDSIYNDTNKQD